MYIAHTYILGVESVEFASAQKATYISNTSSYDYSNSESNWELGHVKIKAKTKNILSYYMYHSKTEPRQLRETSLSWTAANCFISLQVL